MSKLKKLLVQKADEERGLIRKLAKALGLSDSVINKFKNIPEKELDSFEILIQLVRLLDENNELVLMIDYSEGIDVNNKTARYMLEYLAINRQTKALRNLLDRMKKAGNRDSKEWASFYELLYTQLTDYYRVNYKQRTIDMVTYKTSTVEVSLMRELLNIYSYYKDNQYKTMLNLIEVVEGSLGEIKDAFIAKAYLARLLEMKSHAYLMLNEDTEGARKIAQQNIDSNVSKKFTAYANHIIGQSYLYESYDEGMKYLNRSIEMYKEVQFADSVEQTQDTIELFAAVWGKEIEFTTEKCLNLSNAYKGKKTDTKCVFEDKEFEYLISGMENKDFNLLVKSLIRFIKKGDKFLANLAKIQLDKIDYNYDFIYDVIDFHN